MPSFQDWVGCVITPVKSSFSPAEDFVGFDDGSYLAAGEWAILLSVEVSESVKRSQLFHITLLSSKGLHSRDVFDTDIEWFEHVTQR